MDIKVIENLLLALKTMQRELLEADENYDEQMMRIIEESTKENLKYKNIMNIFFLMKELSTAANKVASVVNSNKDVIERLLYRTMDDAGIDDAKTELASFKTKIETKFSVSDKEKFLSWCFKHNRMDFIQSRCTTDPIREYYENENLIPDGISSYDKETVKTRRR